MVMKTYLTSGMDAVLDLKLPPRQNPIKKRKKKGKFHVKISEDGHVILKLNHKEDESSD